MSLVVGESMWCLGEQVGCAASFWCVVDGNLEWDYLFDNHILGRPVLGGAGCGYDWESLLGQRGHFRNCMMI